MRCQHCGKRLPILRKLTDGEFCSPAHRRSFQEEQERQALSRLLEASQMGASRRASEAPVAPAPPKPEKATAGKKTGAIPDPCERFFPLHAPERRSAFSHQPNGPLPIVHRLELTDELARRNPPRIQRRLRGAGLYRHLSFDPSTRTLAAAALAEPSPLGAPPPAVRTVSRQAALPAARLALTGRRAIRLGIRRESPSLAQHLASALAYRVQPAPRLRPHSPRLQAASEWTPPRPIEATRMADALRNLPPQGKNADCPIKAVAIRPPAAPTPSRILPPAAARIPRPPALAAQSTLLRPNGPGAHLNPLTGLAHIAVHPTPTAAPEPWARLGGSKSLAALRLQATSRLLPITLNRQTAGPTPASGISSAWHAPQLNFAPPQRNSGGRTINLRGSWLKRLPRPAATAPTQSPQAGTLVALRFAANPPVPPSSHRAQVAKPGLAEQLLELPARFRPERRVLADRGRMLFLSVMAKPLGVDVPLSPPKRRKPAGPLDLQQTAGTLPIYAAATVRAVHRTEDSLTVAQAPGLALLRPDSQEIEVPLSTRPLLGAHPRILKRLLRWTPTLPLCVEGAGLASFPATWHSQHLKALPPLRALRPDPARTQKRRFVPDVLRQMPFALKPASPLSRIWSLAPADLRWVALAIPVVLGLAWWTLAPKSRPSPAGEVTPSAEVAVPAPKAETPLAGARRAAPAVATRTLPAKVEADAANKTVEETATAEPAPAEGLLAGFFGPFQEKIRARAAVEVSDDFRSGLSAWEGDRGWSEGWSYDQAGFVVPGALALLRPTTGLTDYTFEFLGMIDQRALSWVFRAKDTRNYYAGKLVTVQAGPLPVIAFVRYRVVNGREEARKVITLPQQVRSETLYRIRIDVAGNDFTTSVLEKTVDTFTDTVHPRGGIGLFSARGEKAKIRWVEVSHQYDSFGRLCAFLAPPILEPRPAERPLSSKKAAPKKRGS